MSTIELSLAGGIASCPAVQDALTNKSHPCHKVVHEQTKLIDVEIKRQRPEPWMGGLAKANLLFVASVSSSSSQVNILKLRPLLRFAYSVCSGINGHWRYTS